MCKGTGLAKTKDKKDIIAFLSEQKALGEVFVESGMFKDVKSVAEAQVKILAGRELGFSALESMTNVYIVNGKIACQAKAIAGLIKRSPKYGYFVDVITDKECTITFFEFKQLGNDSPSEKIELGKSTFSIEDAAKAGLINKDVWKNYPRNLLYARSMSNGAKWYCPDVYSGYIVEELEDTPPIKTVVTMNGEGEVGKEKITEVKEEVKGNGDK